MVTNPKYLQDRFAIAVGGHNSGDDPEFIEPTQYADSKNVTMRGGRVKSRPRFVVKVDSDNFPSNNAAEEYFQGACFFKSEEQIVIRSKGRMYQMAKDSVDGTLTEILREDVTVWTPPVSATITVFEGTNDPGVNTINVDIDGNSLATAVDWATSNAATADALASAINSDGTLNTIVTATGNGDGTLTIVEDAVIGGNWFPQVVQEGDVVAGVSSAQIYFPNLNIAQGRTIDRPSHQTDEIIITAGTASAGVNTINVTIDGNSLAASIDWATSHGVTADALASAINSDGTLNTIVSATSNGSGKLWLTSLVAGTGFTASTTDAGDVQSLITTTTANPSPMIATGTYFYDWTRLYLLKWNGSSWDQEESVVTQDIPLDANPDKEQVWFTEVGGVLVTQDGQKTPVKYDGAYWSYAPDVPVGTAMRFANGRLHLVSAGSRRNLFIGDILQNGDAETALKFTESSYLLGGGSLAFPDEIRALHEIPIMDTGTGQGSMVVGTSRDIHAVRTEITDRDLWQTVDGFVRPLLPGIGFAGPDSVVSVNNDLYFRSTNGLRSLRMAVGEQQTPGYGGLHQEIPEKFYQWGIKHNSTCHADDRLLTLVSPRLVNARWVFDGAVVINFESINRLGQKSPLAFDGYWTLPDGHYFRQIFDVDGVAHAVVLTPDGDELWELKKDKATDFDETPTAEITTRKMNGGDPGGIKAVRRIDIWLSEISTDVNLDVYVRVDNDPDWTHWRGYDDAGSLLANTLQVTRTVGAGYNPAKPKDYISRFTLTDLPTQMNGYSFQFKLVWTGRCRLDNFQAYFQPFAENAYTEHENTITLT
jgi:hypothetical protein